MCVVWLAESVWHTATVSVCKCQLHNVFSVHTCMSAVPRFPACFKYRGPCLCSSAVFLLWSYLC